jgi:hypothetical protein
MSMLSRSRAAKATVATVVGLVALSAGPAAYAADTSGTATITAGSLSMTAPATVAFTATLGGVDQNVTAPQSLHVLDATGTGVGWNVTATSTTFTAGARTLSTSAVTEPAAPTQSCDEATACTLATNAVSYPYTLPAGTVAPTATKIIGAAAGTGLGGQTSVHTMQLAVPANTFAGSYASTWTYSLVSAP